MDLALNRLEAKNSNKKENQVVKNKKTNFISDKINLDKVQSMLMKENYENLTNNTNYKLMTNGFQSINDNLDYVECINNNCSKVNNESMVNKEKDLVKDKKTNGNNVMMKNLDILVSLVYIFLLVILLLGSVINRDANNLVNILIITLIYLFYQYYMSSRK
tara:strand:+ start:1833 stop:2315 length:483 start_codon:yes stop_codon:yes gene_type:complete